MSPPCVILGILRGSSMLHRTLLASLPSSVNHLHLYHCHFLLTLPWTTSSKLLDQPLAGGCYGLCGFVTITGRDCFLNAPSSSWEQAMFKRLLIDEKSSQLKVSYIEIWILLYATSPDHSPSPKDASLPGLQPDAMSQGLVYLTGILVL